METQLIQRLNRYAELTGTAPDQVASIKLRPIEPGAQYTDPFGRTDANGYLYTSEYEAGRAAAQLQAPSPKAVEVLTSAVSHPSPWSGQSLFEFSATQPPVYWVQHETGLEILGAVGTVVGIITGCITIWEKIRDRINQNKTAQETDRHWKQVTEIRIEVRRLTETANLFRP